MIKNVVEKNKNIDVNENKINKLKEMFPNCFNINGEFDISVFEEELKTNTSIVKEGYGLNFLGKNYAKYVASLETETILVPDEDNNRKEENKNSENIYISGDNIDALKHLVKSYSGQIKCIYIDPPYNTGSDGFVYNDKFNLTIEKLIAVLDVNEDEAKRIYSMTNSKSNSHSAWLTFMYPRLYVAKQLLKGNGVIYISIDNNEQAQLKLLCDSIFGEENFISNFIWQKNFAPKNDNKYISDSTEYILLYAKNKEKFRRGLLPREEKHNKGYSNPDNDPRGAWTSGSMLATSYSPTGVFEIVSPNGKKNIPPSGKCWRFSKDTVQKLISENKIWWGNDGNGVPRIKRFLNEMPDGIVPQNLMPYTEAGSNQDGNLELKKLFDAQVFDYPKNTKLLKRLLSIANLSNDDTVLDFFGGSSTTAHAVMKYNVENKIKCKYILIQLEEKYVDKTGKYEFNSIDKLGQERIRRAAREIKEETNTDIDYGFKHYTIKDVNTNTLDKLEKFEPNYVISDGSILDEFGINAVLTTWMNEDGYGLNDKYEKLELEDYTAYKCQNTIYLLNWNISDLFIKALIEKYEKEENFDCNRIVMFGYSFTLNEIQTLKDNLQQVKNIKGINVELITRY